MGNTERGSNLFFSRWAPTPFKLVTEPLKKQLFEITSKTARQELKNKSRVFQSLPQMESLNLIWIMKGLMILVRIHKIPQGGGILNLMERSLPDVSACQGCLPPGMWISWRTMAVLIQIDAWTLSPFLYGGSSKMGPPQNHGFQYVSILSPGVIWQKFYTYYGWCLLAQGDDACGEVIHHIWITKKIKHYVCMYII